MTTTQHTPGPWKAVYSEYGEEIWFGGNDGPGMWEIEGAEAYLPGDHDEQARLIAAAPDLLAALQYAAQFLADEVEQRGLAGSDMTDYQDEAAQALDRVEAAIAKATGQDVP